MKYLFFFSIKTNILLKTNNSEIVGLISYRKKKQKQKTNITPKISTFCINVSLAQIELSPKSTDNEVRNFPI